MPFSRTSILRYGRQGQAAQTDTFGVGSVLPFQGFVKLGIALEATKGDKNLDLDQVYGAVDL